MARLISVCDKDLSELKPRQLPVEVDDIQMVVQFSDKCVDCGKLCRFRQKDLDRFTSKFQTLTKDEVALALLVPGRDILNLLPVMVPCVGCRKSVERLLFQLQTSQHRALEPLVITTRGELSVQHEFLFDPQSLFALFHVHGPKLQSVVEAILKSKKNKRCNLHCLDSHKSKTLGCWLDVWDALSESCQEKVLVIDLSQLMTTIDSYLDKHKFCTECKLKVMTAYNILVGQQEGSGEGYCAALFENLRFCGQEQHIHVLNDTDFVADLLEKAEPEFLGGRRDRHAKTLDIAQEEILTCVGIHIFERLHRIWQKLRSEEQTWLILLYMGVDALRKSYQVALEKRQGMTDLELLCQEIQEQETRLGVKREIKRQKKKQKKARVPTISPNSVSHEILPKHLPCKCPEGVPDNHHKNTNNNNHHHDHHQHCRCPDSSHGANFKNFRAPSLPGFEFSIPGLHRPPTCGSNTKERCCVGSGAGSVCDKCDSECESSSCVARSCQPCQCDTLRTQRIQFSSHQNHISPNLCRHTTTFQSGEQPSLQDLLEELCLVGDSDEEDQKISEEEILAFKSRQVEVESKRLKLRENLRLRFQELHQSSHLSST